MKIRCYQHEDGAVLAEVFSESIRSTATRGYSSQQIEAWAFVPTDKLDWCKRLGSQIVFVAEENSEITGYITFELNGHLDHLYVLSHLQRRGVASMLYRRVEEEARLHGVVRIFTEASITSRPFFECLGFRLIAPQTVVHRGISFVN